MNENTAIIRTSSDIFEANTLFILVRRKKCLRIPLIRGAEGYVRFAPTKTSADVFYWPSIEASRIRLQHSSEIRFKTRRPAGRPFPRRLYDRVIHWLGQFRLHRRGDTAPSECCVGTESATGFPSRHRLPRPTVDPHRAHLSYGARRAPTVWSFRLLHLTAETVGGENYGFSLS